MSMYWAALGAYSNSVIAIYCKKIKERVKLFLVESG